MRKWSSVVGTWLGLVVATFARLEVASAQVQPAVPALPEQPAPGPIDPPTPSPGSGADGAVNSGTMAPPAANQLPPGEPARQGSPPQPPAIRLQKDPPLPPPEMRTDHVHDGFYARLSLGFGSLGTKMNAPNSGAVKGDGSSLALDVSIGYAVSPGIILGGTLLVESLPSATMELGRSGMTGTSDITAALLGPFFDGYPNVRGGLHLGGALGFASSRVQRPEEAAGFRKAGGFGLAGWIGYDVWVAEQWSAGLLIRMMGTRTKGDADATANNDAGSATMATQSIALMLTGVYN